MATRSTIWPRLVCARAQVLGPTREQGGGPQPPRLLADIRRAETARELLLYVRNFHSDAAEFRNLLNLIESEIITKIEQFAREVEVIAETPRIVPSNDAKR